jgi:hypothetical protein
MSNSSRCRLRQLWCGGDHPLELVDFVAQL